MQAHPHPLLRVFQPDIQYVVPIFQRRYVWNEEEQWADLWDDLIETMRLVAEAEALREDGVDVPLPSHFMGAIVVDLSLSTGSEVDRRPLIDGQQRLTTLQVLLSCVHRAAVAREADRAVGLVSRLTENDPALVATEADRFKLSPSDPDRAAFHRVMTSGAALDNDSDDDPHLIEQADQFFTDSIESWLATSEDDETALVQLARTLRRNVELVVIDLEIGDNAQVIFESLNYGGRELLAIDLVKNHVFFQASAQDLDLHQLHSDYWIPFDTDWWREEVSQGRYYRPRAELFLMHWLKLEHLKEIAAHRLFVEFKTLPAFTEDLVGTVQRLARDRDIYKKADLDAGGLPADLGGFPYRLNSLNQSTPRPVLLQLLRAVPSEIAAETASRAFAILDSYLVRRMLMNRTPANYNRIMLEVLQALNDDLANADALLADHLASLEGASVNWPTDEELASNLKANAIYGPGRVGARRIAMVLRNVENEWRSSLSEAPIPPDAELQVEHILPQSWKEHWPVPAMPEEDRALREEEREASVHRIGNLTLVSVPMNPTLSNSPWIETTTGAESESANPEETLDDSAGESDASSPRGKRDILRDHSTALITRRYLDGEYASEWNEAAISKRGGEIIETIKQLWPGPGSTPRDRPVDA